MLNESEATQIAGNHDFMASGEAVSQKVRIVFLTRGASGVSVFENGELLGHVSALEVSSVDATGAGDTFCGYTIAGLSQGMDAMAAAKLGTIAAGISVQFRGASNSIPLRHEVDELLAKT
jgi:ribokinase